MWPDIFGVSSSGTVLYIMFGGLQLGFLYLAWKTVHTLVTRKIPPVCQLHAGMEQRLTRIEDKIDSVLDAVLKRV